MQMSVVRRGTSDERGAEEREADVLAEDLAEDEIAGAAAGGAVDRAEEREADTSGRPC